MPFLLCLLPRQSLAQDCATTQPSAAVCSDVAEDFNGDNGGFVAGPTATGTFGFNGATAFDRNLDNTNNAVLTSVITSRTFTKSANQVNNIQAGLGSQV